MSVPDGTTPTPTTAGEVPPEIIGYTSPLAVRPGEGVEVMVSSSAPRYTAEVVRLRHGDESERGPGVRWSPVSFGPDGDHPGRRQVARPGSFGIAAVDLPPGSITLQAWVLPTSVHADRRQVIVQLDSGLCLELSEAGHLVGALPDGTRVVSRRRMEPWRWLFVALVVDEGLGLVSLDVRECDRPGRTERITQGWTGSLPEVSTLVLASAMPEPGRVHPARVDGFDGRIEAPCAMAAAVAPEALDALADGGPVLVGTFARWHFDQDPGRVTVPTSGPAGSPMILHHCPQRLVLGHHDRADGDGGFPTELLCAAHFHQDDLEDAAWEVDLSFQVPADAASAVYGVRLRIEGDEEIVPFFVRPPAGGPTAEVAVLLPTFSYLAYANERLQDAPRDVPVDGERGLPILPDRGDRILHRRDDLGLSTYDNHRDGSGCCFSSARRPILNLRPTHRNWQTHAPRALAADLYLVDWLEEIGTGFDVLDDGLVHDEGRALLAGYPVVITGAHPEYWSEQMLDALDGFLETGGRVMYLGGNGFYWVTSVDRERPHLIEVRRGHNGTRSWEPRPGELRHETTGEVGGLWRYRGRGPNRSVGVGFAAQGYDPKAAAFARTPDAADDRVTWMFDGVADGLIGDAGLIMDGAAGDEFDRADGQLGTPPHALVVATSAGRHSDNVSVVVEDLLIAHPGVGGAHHPLVRADVVFFETEDGGAVFSAGSMGWTGCLSQDDYGNPLARLTGNVLRRFLDPTPFPPVR